MKFIRLYLPPLVWMAVIFWFSSQQRLQVSPVFAVQFVFFKTLHLIEYAILCVLWIAALRPTTMWTVQTVLTVALSITVLFAGSDELHQLFVPTREGAVRDVIIDALGAILGMVTVWKLLPTLLVKHNN